MNSATGNKYVTLKAAVDAAEAALETATDTDAALRVCEAADRALFTYEEKVLKLKREFEELVRTHDEVDMCVCMENAGDATGHTERDIEYWHICLATAREMVPASPEQPGSPHVPLRP